jgi:hypothetical protein
MVYVIILSLTTLCGFITTFYFKKKFNQVNAEIETLLQIYNTDEGKVVQESFLKFVSDSREWAYEYIEDVQANLKIFKNLVEKDIEYFDKFGVVGSAYPHYEAMQRFSSGYKIIEEMLPKE